MARKERFEMTTENTARAVVADEAEKFVQVGYTALRDPITGGYLPAVPLYVKAEGGAEEAEQRLIDDLGNLFAQHMKSYVDGCKEAGLAV
jgi:hypothetical protein